LELLSWEFVLVLSLQVAFTPFWILACQPLMLLLKSFIILFDFATGHLLMPTHFEGNHEPVAKRWCNSGRLASTESVYRPTNCAPIWHAGVYRKYCALRLCG
jgi:hypothetical protein